MNRPKWRHQPAIARRPNQNERRKDAKAPVANVLPAVEAHLVGVQLVGNGPVEAEPARVPRGALPADR